MPRGIPNNPKKRPGRPRKSIIESSESTQEQEFIRLVLQMGFGQAEAVLLRVRTAVDQL